MNLVLPGAYQWAPGPTTYMFLFALAFKRDEKASYYEHYPSILVSFVGKAEHFSVKNGAF